LRHNIATMVSEFIIYSSSFLLGIAGCTIWWLPELITIDVSTILKWEALLSVLLAASIVLKPR